MQKKTKKSWKISFKLPEFILIMEVAVSFFFLALSSSSFILNFKELGFASLSVLQNGAFKVMGIFESAINKSMEWRNLKAKYEAQCKRLENYERMQRENVDIKKENMRLREELGYVSSLKRHSIFARIIAMNTDELYSTYTINKGSEDGIRKDMIVTALEKGMSGVVGKIIQVGKHTAMLMSVFNSDCIISCRVQNSRYIGLCRGQGSKNKALLFENVSKHSLERIRIGDIVSTSGINDNYVSGIAVGTVSKIKEMEYSPTLYIELSPVVDFDKLEHVVVFDVKNNEVN